MVDKARCWNTKVQGAYLFHIRCGINGFGWKPIYTESVTVVSIMIRQRIYCPIHTSYAVLKNLNASKPPEHSLNQEGGNVKTLTWDITHTHTV